MRNTFTLSGPPPGELGGVHSYTAITVTRQDIGTITDFTPLIITSAASNAEGRQGLIKAGIWLGLGGEVYVRNWQVNYQGGTDAKK